MSLSSFRELSYFGIEYRICPKRSPFAPFFHIVKQEGKCMWKGIDVSDNQGVIDWGKAAAAGVQFAILRSVRRSGQADHRFGANLEGCRRHKIPAAVYRYTYAVTETQAEEEAGQVTALLRSHGLAGTMVWWDVEDRERLQPLGSTRLTELIRTAQAQIEAAGYCFGIYTGLYVYKEGWFDFGAFACPLWIARYPGTAPKTWADSPSERYRPSVGRAIWGWQWTDNGRLPGIDGPVDFDICYQDPAEAVQKQLADIGICGVVHKVRILE